MVSRKELAIDDGFIYIRSHFHDLQHAFENTAGGRVDSWLASSALDSGVNGPGLSPGWAHCVVFLGKTLYSHSASLQPGV